MNFIRKVYDWMNGRYGFDELYTFLLYSYVMVLCAGLVFHSTVLLILEFLIFIWMFSRVFSKNIFKRKKENRFYLKVRSKILKPFQTIQRNWKDRNDFIYKKCRKCKTTLKLPLPTTRGLHYASCPKCKKRLRIFCLRKEEIEIITADGKKKRV